jgi:hypothetical protein
MASSYYYLYLGIGEYKTHCLDERAFQVFEKRRVDLVFSYPQYGGDGIRIFWKRSPMIIFTGSGKIVKATATLDTREVVDIVQSREEIPPGRRFRGFFDIVLLFGCLMHFIYGGTLFPNKKNLRLFRRPSAAFMLLLLRLAVLLIYFSLVLAGGYGMVRFCGIRVDEIRIYASISAYILFILMFCYLVAAAFSFIPYRKVSISLLVIFAFIFLVVIPENLAMGIHSNRLENPDLEKINTLLKFELKAKDMLESAQKDKNRWTRLKRELYEQFFQNEFRDNELLERNILRDTLKRTGKFEKKSIFFPIAYFNFFVNEASSQGNYSYGDFFNYILETRERFVKYVLYKRHFTNEKKVESFIKNDENIFQTRATMIPSFAGSMFIIFLYILVLMLLVGIACRLGIERSGENSIALYDFKAGNIYFRLFGSCMERDGVWEQFSRGGNVTSLDGDMTGLSPYTGLPVIDVVRFLSLIREISLERILQNVEYFKLDFTRPLKFDDIPLLYLAFKLSEECDCIVLNDFLKNKSKLLHDSLIYLLIEKVREGKIVIYLSTTLFEIRSEFGEVIKSKFVSIGKIDTVNFS